MRVVEAELAHALQLFRGRSRAVGLDAQQLADLHGGGAHSAGDRVNQHAALMLVGHIDRLDGVGGHSGFPVSEIGGEEVHGKRRRLLRGPSLGLRPEHLALDGDLLGSGAVLRIAHHALAGVLDDAGELASAR